MKKLFWMVPAGVLIAGAGWILQAAGGKSDKIDTKDLVTGQQAFRRLSNGKARAVPQDHRRRSSEALRHQIEPEFPESGGQARKHVAHGAGRFQGGAVYA